MIWRWTTLFPLLLLAGCVTIQSHRNADPYVIRHHTWWNHYQRGRLHLRDGDYAAARTDFEIALGRRPGARYSYAQERWRARTYGMHMIEGYFPHRELGICLLEMDQPQQALVLLETSMKQEPSARAKFYLNRIRRQLASAAAPPPELRIAALPDWTARTTITLQGVAAGTNRIANISINDQPEFIELAAEQIDFRHELRLTEGRNSIRIVAEDLAGKQTATNLIVTADWTAPQIHLRRSGSKRSIVCKDNLGLHELRTNGIAVAAHSFILPATANRPLQLKAADRAGNRIEWTLSKKELRHLAQNPPAAPPRLTLADAGKILTLYSPEYTLDIRAEDDTGLRTVELNGTNLLKQPTPLFRTMRRIPLDPGTNHLTVATQDFNGNYAEECITVIRRQPEYLDRIYRLAAALSPLAGEVPDLDFRRRVDRIIGRELTHDPARFFLLAGNHEVEALHNEQKLSGSELADPRVLLKAGRQLNADLVFVARVLSDAPGQTIYAQVLEAESGDELFIEDVYVEDAEQLPHQLGGLAMKLEQRFPLIKANLHRLENRLTIDAGQAHGAHKGMRFLVIRSGGAFEQGHVLQTGTRPVELVVSGIESDSARVIIPAGQTGNPVQSGDFVFTR